MRARNSYLARGTQTKLLANWPDSTLGRGTGKFCSGKWGRPQEGSNWSLLLLGSDKHAN